MLFLLRKNRDVVIKPVSYGDPASNELRILQYLNSDALRADKTNATVPVMEFVKHFEWTFAVTPRWTDSTSPEFANIGEVLDWAVQLINVSGWSDFHSRFAKLTHGF